MGKQTTHDIKDPTEWQLDDNREQLLAEAHARPAQPVTPPARILHLSFRAAPDVYEKFFSALDSPADASTIRHYVGTVDATRIKLERHTEFMSCTVLRDGKNAEDGQSLSRLLNRLFPMGDVEIIVLLRLHLVKTASQMVKLLPGGARVYGGNIRGDLDARSNFRPDENGFINFYMQAKNQTSDQLGRRIQRLIEMETYRTMALLGLPKARAVSATLAGYEKELDLLTTSLKEDVDATPDEDETLFSKLSSLSERNNALASELRYRFAASRAYYDLFQQRITSLEEQKVGDLQTMSGFLRARMEPAIATIESTARRQETLTNDLSRALVLLRTRIELNLNKGNQELLQSMDRRHDQHLKIARTVEGLSVVAITYYAVGLFSYLLKALAKQPWMPLSETLLTAMSVPIILACVWFTLARVRKGFEK